MKIKRIISFFCLLSSIVALIVFMANQLIFLKLNEISWWYFSLFASSSLVWVLFALHYQKENIANIEFANKISERHNNRIIKECRIWVTKQKMHDTEVNGDWQEYGYACAELATKEKSLNENILPIRTLDYKAFYFYVFLQVVLLIFYLLAIF